MSDGDLVVLRVRPVRLTNCCAGPLTMQFHDLRLRQHYPTRDFTQPPM